jgi:hypothetical protein
VGINPLDLRKRTMAGRQGGSWFGHGGQQGGQAPPPVTSQYPGAGGGQYPQPTGAPGGGYRADPTGELVTVFCESNRNYRLTSRPDGVVLAYKNQQDPKQYWIKIDIGDKFTDEEGQPGFILVNKATGMALSHGMESGAAVTQEPYRANAIDNSVLFSSGLNLGKGWHAIRTVTNIHLNLDADHGDKKHGGIQEGNRLVVCNWNNQENQKWMITAVGPED